jgi:DNA processing protein
MAVGPAHEDLLSWIRLARSEGIGAKTFRQIIERFGSAKEAVDRLPEVVHSGGRPVKLAPWAEIEREFAAAERAGLTYVTWHHPDFPAPLKAIEDAPPLLVVKGRTDS